MRFTQIKRVAYARPFFLRTLNLPYAQQRTIDSHWHATEWLLKALAQASSSFTSTSGLPLWEFCTILRHSTPHGDQNIQKYSQTIFHFLIQIELFSFLHNGVLSPLSLNFETSTCISMLNVALMQSLHNRYTFFLHMPIRAFYHSITPIRLH